jgi:hypothetical protein
MDIVCACIPRTLYMVALTYQRCCTLSVVIYLGHPTSAYVPRTLHAIMLVHQGNQLCTIYSSKQIPGADEASAAGLVERRTLTATRQTINDPKVPASRLSKMADFSNTLCLPHS